MKATNLIECCQRMFLINIWEYICGTAPSMGRSERYERHEARHSSGFSRNSALLCSITLATTSNRAFVSKHKEHPRTLLFLHQVCLTVVYMTVTPENVKVSKLSRLSI